MSRISEIAESLQKEGCVLREGLVVKRATVCEVEGDFTRICITLSEGEVERYNVDGNGDPVKVKDNKIYLFDGQINAILNEDEDVAGITNHCSKHPDCYGIILPGAKINIIEQDVPASDPEDASTFYHNPFSSDDSKTRLMKHQTMVHHLVMCKLSKRGKEKVARIEDKMCGF